MKIEWNGIAMEISQEMLIEIMTNHILKEREETVLEEVLDENQTTLKDYDLRAPRDYSRPAGHAKGWRSHCARCGTVGRKCLERLNGRCHTCKDFEDNSCWSLIVDTVGV